MDRMVLVYVDLGGVPYLVGRLWSHAREGRESCGAIRPSDLVMWGRPPQ
jgi:hypothetical protein